MFVSTLFEKTDRCDVITQIDRKISETGKQIYQKYAFGTKECSDSSNSLILSDLRQILVAKLNNHDCFNGYSKKEIENVIKKYLY